MPDTNARFEEWISERFGSLGDVDITSTFRKVAKAAFEEGVKVGSNPTTRLHGGFPSPRSQFDDTDASDRPDAPRSAPRPRSTTQFDDAPGYDRPDARAPTPQRRPTSQFDDDAGHDRPDNTRTQPTSFSSSQFSDTNNRR
ncbi:hypothetical protein OIU34_17110 [Pararhizobium sp. BT-229]|uniref:hypothetical protein n=1 Tax=Pararhizobium sp. BT-229 TaxID=2986923 RepID=UPI0021F7F50D|nr:hypothetical protein [Pararhizobium sp. BT-229]MCV9963621.1 hypothetical protein [Pararhizobium sp. BT-229]